MLTTREHLLGASRASSSYFYQPLPASACCVTTGNGKQHSHHYENLICDPLSGFHPSSCSSSYYQSASASAHTYLPFLSTSPELPSPTSAEQSPPLPHFQRLNSVSTSSSSDVASPDVARKMTDNSVSVVDSSYTVIDGQPNQCHSNETFIASGQHSSSSLCPVPWALVSKRDNSQLNIEARNGFVNFIGVDITSCELVLGTEQTDSTIDGRQAVLVFASGSFHIKDLNSSYGTYINERRVPSRCFVQLNEHDEVRFGFSANVYLLLKLPSFSSSSSPSSAPSPPAVTPSNQSSTNSLQIADDNELSSSLQAISKTTGPMNKLLRLKSGSRRKPTKDRSKDSTVVDCTGATSKLSPSSSSLMSSASSNSSSSSSSTTSPSSVFMSAMKMMKMRFKKKSNKDKSMVCSANDDITFIRYDSHNDVASAQSLQSASAPESPSQPHSRIFRSNTCLDSCDDRDNLSTPHGQHVDNGDLVCISSKGKSHFTKATTLPEVEHDYDEVAREEDTNSTGVAEGLVDLDECLSAEISHCDLIEENEVGSTLDSVIDEFVNEDDDTFNDLLEENDDDDDDNEDDIVYGGHVDAYAEFENCLLDDHYATSHHFGTSGDLESFDPGHHVIRRIEEKQTISNCSSMIVLPHLNSDDRLNNNSSLDTLLTDSILAKNLSHCETSMQVDSSVCVASCQVTNSQVADNGTASASSLVSLTHHPQLKDHCRQQQPLFDHSLTPSTGQEDNIATAELIIEPSSYGADSIICLDPNTTATELCTDLRITTFKNVDDLCSLHYQPQSSSLNKSLPRTVANNNNNNNNNRASSQHRFSLRSNSHSCSSGASHNHRSSSSSICPNDHGNYHHNRTLFDNEAKQLEQQESCYQSALSSVETALSEELSGQPTSCGEANVAVAATGDLQTNIGTAANGDSCWRESLDSAESECKYDIDDIGHLRRNIKTTAPSIYSTTITTTVTATTTILASASITEMTSHSLNLHDSNNRPACGQAQLSLKDTQNESRHSHGGVAFVISLDDDSEAGLSKTLNDKLFVSSRRDSQKAKRASSNLNEQPFYHPKSARPRNVIAKSSPPMTAAPALLSSACSRNDDNNSEVMLLLEEEEEEVHTLKAVTKNRDILDDTNKPRQHNQDSKLNIQKVPEEYTAYGFSSKHQPQQLTNVNNSDNNNSNNNNDDDDFCNDINWNNSDPTMKKIKNSVDTSDASSKASSSSSIRRNNRAAQLSESAVYLINRMFEDSDYHRYHDNVEANDRYGNYPEANCYPDSSPRHEDQQSISSSRSASPYSLRDNRQYHNSLANYICNSSGASTRMEYDESLSSHHTNFNSGQRLSRLESLSTVVQTNSIHEKQEDSAIDDADLIPDDLSDTGTYTIEIDDCGEHKMKKGSNSNNSNNNSCDDLASQNKQVKWPQSDKNVTTGEQSTDDDIPAVATDYEADADYELEDEDDKLEIARRKIDELFNVYSNKNDKTNDTASNNGSQNTNSTVNNSTFTRSKRRSSQQNETQVEADDETIAGSATSDEYFPTVSKPVETTKPTKFNTKSSKSQISNELMNALKKINSKLDKTAKLASDSLSIKNKSKADKLESAPASKIRPMTTYKPSNQRSPSSQSAPSTPVLSSVQNRKNYRPKLQTKVSQPLSSMSSRKNSITNSASSIDERYTSADDFDDHSSAVSTETYAARPRSESVNSTASTQSGLMRFNRAFALRRARLGMDTCGVEISDQAASKAKDSYVKPGPKLNKQPSNNSFKRSDGGRFSLRVPSTTPASPGVGRRSTATDKQSSARKPFSTTKASVSSATKPIVTKSKLPSSKTSSVENLPLPKISSPRVQRKQRILSTTSPIVPPVAPVRKSAHSDNEIVHDSESSCDEAPLFSRFGRSSLRTPVSTANSSTPWLQSLKANSPNLNSVKQRIPTTTAASSLYNPMQKSSSFSANAGKNYSQRGSHVYISETYDSLSSPTTATTECVRSIPSFQMGKRFFSTKPHQMAQFDRDFSSVARCSSAAMGANGNKLPPDPNLMTHSATESLLSRHGVSASTAINPDLSGHRVETSPPISTQAAQSITSNINARIFSISPLDSLVISAINQLSSKLRTRMRDVLEQERSNRLIGSETRSLIDEILPQVSTVSGLDSRSCQSKNAFPHEASNISRDLSNILKNLKKVEQIFDVFYMLLEPNDSSISNCQEISSEHISSYSANSQAIVTHASDSDNSDSQLTTKHSYLSSAMANSAKPAGPMAHHHHRSHSGPALSRFAPRQPPPPPPSHSPPSDSTPSPLHLSRNGFFIEL